MTCVEFGLDRFIVGLPSLTNPGEFNVARLGNLSLSELRSFDKWDSEFAFSPRRPRPVKSCCSPFVESKVDGDFEVWDGDTIFKLKADETRQQGPFE